MKVGLGEEGQNSSRPSAPEHRGHLTDMARTDSRNLYYFILKRVGDPHEAEDLMQQTFEEALRNLDQFRGDCLLRTWVYGIATNLLRNHLNRSPSRVYEFEPEESLDDLASAEAGPEEAVSRSDWLEKLDYCLEQLPEEMRLTILHVLINERSCDDAAEALKVPVGTIRSRLHRARKLLREKMEGNQPAIGVPKPPVLPGMRSQLAQSANVPGAALHMTKPVRPLSSSPPVTGSFHAEIDAGVMHLKTVQESLLQRMKVGSSLSLYDAQKSLADAVSTALHIFQRLPPPSQR